MIADPLLSPRSSTLSRLSLFPFVCQEGQTSPGLEVGLFRLVSPVDPQAGRSETDGESEDRGDPGNSDFVRDFGDEEGDNVTGQPFGDLCRAGLNCVPFSFLTFPRTVSLPRSPGKDIPKDGSEM